jgi:hypothetical protein
MWDELGLPARCDGVEANEVVGRGRDGAEHEGGGEANKLGGGVEAGRVSERTSRGEKEGHTRWTIWATMWAGRCRE